MTTSRPGRPITGTVVGVSQINLDRLRCAGSVADVVAPVLIDEVEGGDKFAEVQLVDDAPVHSVTIAGGDLADLEVVLDEAEQFVGALMGDDRLGSGEHPRFGETVDRSVDLGDDVCDDRREVVRSADGVVHFLTP
jgi:hypothetical protein